MKTRSNDDIHIIGAGPAGLAAALYLARAGLKPVVFEQAPEVGARFDGTFQGLENWSSEEDATDVLARLGIRTNFRCAPFEGGAFYGPSRRRYDLHATRPLFYLVERGSGPQALDRGLKEQALAAGAEIRFGEHVERSAARRVIVATGPRAPDAVARGMTFETSHPDACIGFLDERLAPGGYAYLLAHEGRATLATCLFDDFPQADAYLDRTLEAVREEIGIDVRSPRRWGGYVNFSMAPPFTRNGRFYFVGERAGFQDALWGFGLRYALLSGILAGRAIAMNEDYDALCRRHIVPVQQLALANRVLFRQLGNRGYEWALGHAEGGNVMGPLRRHHQPSRTKTLLYEIARKSTDLPLVEPACDGEDCTCLWCEHGARADAPALDASAVNPAAADHHMNHCGEEAPALPEHA